MSTIYSKTMQGLFIVMMVIAFFAMETNHFTAYLVWIGLTALVGLIAYTPKEYTDESDDIEEYVSTDGLCSFPWDRCSDANDCASYVLRVKGKPEAYVQAINPNEAIGIYLVNNPGMSYDDISEIRTA